MQFTVYGQLELAH